MKTSPTKIEQEPEISWIKRINSFSKWITLFWIVVWIETILFSQLAVIIGFGDAMSISYINDNVREIGTIICGFYFGSKTFENCFQGFELHRERMAGITPYEPE